MARPAKIDPGRVSKLAHLSDGRAAALLGCCREQVGRVRRAMGIAKPRGKAVEAGRPCGVLCVACLAPAERLMVAGPCCRRCAAWADGIEKRLAYLLDGWDGSTGMPPAVARGQGVHWPARAGDFEGER